MVTLQISTTRSGVLADYGSVARYCSQNCGVPTLLLPPSVLGEQLRTQNVLLVAGADDIQGLKRALELATQQLARKVGDT